MMLLTLIINVLFFSAFRDHVHDVYIFDMIIIISYWLYFVDSFYNVHCQLPGEWLTTSTGYSSEFVSATLLIGNMPYLMCPKFCFSSKLLVSFLHFYYHVDSPIFLVFLTIAPND